MKEKDQIKEAVKELNLVRSEIGETSRLKKEIDGKDTEALSDLEAKLSASEVRKKSMLKQHVLGQVADSDVQLLENEIQTIKTDILREREISAAVNDCQKDLSNKTSELLKKEQMLTHGFWRVVANLLMEDVTNVAKNQFWRVWAAILLSGGGYPAHRSYPHLLNTLFPQPDANKITELIKALNKEFMK